MDNKEAELESTLTSSDDKDNCNVKDDDKENAPHVNGLSDSEPLQQLSRWNNVDDDEDTTASQISRHADADGEDFLTSQHSSQLSRQSELSDYHLVARSSDEEDDDDDDDDASAREGGIGSVEPDKLIAFYLEISIDKKPLIVSDRIGTHVVYVITTRTNSTRFAASQCQVKRRFSDFLGLHQKLVEKHASLGRIVPPPPPKQILGSLSARLSNDDDSLLTSSFMESRRAALERFLSRCAKHPKLRKDSNLVRFLETESELPKATETSSISAAALGRLFAKVGDQVSSISQQKMEETDPWFAEKHQMVETLDAQLKKLQASVESIMVQRRELAANTCQFAHSCALLSSAEEHGGLARAFSHLAEVEEKVEAVHLEQATGDLSRLAETLADYISLLGSVKEVFNQRTKAYHQWQAQNTVLMKKRSWLQAQSYNMAAKSSDKYRAIESELSELELRVETCQRHFDSISSTIRREMRRFEATRIEDFKKMIVRYLETLMAGQRKIVAEIAASVDAMQNNLLSNEEYTTLADLFTANTTPRRGLP